MNDFFEKLFTPYPQLEQITVRLVLESYFRPSHFNGEEIIYRDPRSFLVSLDLTQNDLTYLMNTIKNDFPVIRIADNRSLVFHRNGTITPIEP